MTQEVLREKIGIVLEDFDSMRDADMKEFIDDIMENIRLYNIMQFRDNKKRIIKEYLESALKMNANVW